MRKIILSILVFICVVKNNVTAQYWSALGEGIGEPDGLGTVYSLAVYNGELYAAGNHTHTGSNTQSKILKWGGNNWLTIGEATNTSDEPAVYSLLVYDGAVYAAGHFSTIDNVSAKNIAKWNGAMWSPVGTGISSANVTALTVFNSELYAAGMFDTAGSVEAKSIAKWNGTAWSPVGNILMYYVSSLAVFDGQLYAAGIYDDNVNDSYYYDIAKWDGTNWIPLNCQPDAWINTMIEYNGELYVGGNFSSIGGITANHIAKWNGTNWSAIGMGLGYFGSSIQQVFSLTIHKDSIYGAGFFTTTDGTSCKNIAKWDGNFWIGLGNGLGQDFEEEVYATISNDTVLYAGGNFTIAGNVSAIHIAKWTDQCITSPVQPGNIIGDSLACHSSYQTFSVSPVNDVASYTWTFPAGWNGSSTSNSITTITGTDGGIISVTANNPCGSSPTQTLAFTVNSNPLRPDFISGNDTICQDIPEIYSITPIPGATTYTWSVPGGWWVLNGSSWGYSPTPYSIIAPFNSITVKSPGKSGNILVTADNECGSSDYQTIAITVIQSTVTPPQSIAINGNIVASIGDTLTYSINPVNGLSVYNWSLNGGGTIATGQNTNSITVNWQTPGVYILSVNGTNYCGSSIQQKINIKVTKPGVDDPYEIKLMPNPTSGEFYLKAKRVQDKMINVEVVNMAGQFVISSGKKQGINDYTQLINLDKMAVGLYAVKIMIGDKVYVRSVMIKH